IVLALQEIEDEGRLYLGIGRDAELHQHGDQILLEPFRLGALHPGPIPADESGYLAAIHRERDLGRAGIAGHGDKMRAEHGVEDVGVEPLRNIAAGGAEFYLLTLRLIERLDAKTV